MRGSSRQWSRQKAEAALRATRDLEQIARELRQPSERGEAKMRKLREIRGWGMVSAKGWPNAD
jgi:hypothetical protein